MQHIELVVPGARTIVLDLVTRGDAPQVTTEGLARAAAAFGIAATAMRTAIARLKADGRIRQVARGVYARGPEAESIVRRVRGWRSVADRRGDWDGAWLLAVTGAGERADRTVWRRTLRAFAFEGFDEVEANLWVRPDNLAGGAAAARARLAELGAHAAMPLVRASDVDAARDARWRAGWRRGPDDYRALVAAMAAHRARSGTEPLAQVARTTLVLGREAIRRIVRDPLRPDALGGVAALDALVAEMTRYDAVGQAAWRAFLA